MACCCGCRILLPLAALLLLFCGLMSCALFVYYEFRGSSDTITALGSLVASRGLNTVWCQGVMVRAPDKRIRFNATVVPGPPRVDTKIRHKSTVSMTIAIPAGQNAFLRYYLPATSRIHMLQCSSVPFVKSYIFRGRQVDDDCLKLSERRNPWFGRGADMEDVAFNIRKGHDPCVDITLGMYLVRKCGGAKQAVDASIAADDDYLIFYRGVADNDAQVTLELTLDRPQYDTSEQTASCANATACSLPLRWGSSDVVIVQNGIQAANDTGEHAIAWECEVSYISYALIFGGSPLAALLVLACAALFCRRRCCRNKGKREVAAAAETEPLLADREGLFGREDENLQHVVADVGYGSTKERTVVAAAAAAGSYPTTPSAPPAAAKPFIPDEMFVPPPILNREPPPTYEESIIERSYERSHEREVPLKNAE